MSEPGQLRIGIVAGEASGDQLGAPLIRSLRADYPNAVFEGVGGPLMEAEGLITRHDFQRFCVMGLVEVLGRYRELKAIQRQLVEYFVANPPDVFIGIDAPDFNLGLEAALHAAGIRTVHYVSPSVWAWRQSRLKLIKRATDLMLTLFPFEQSYYQREGIPVRCVGHSLADQIPLEPDQAGARDELGLDQTAKIIALLPGSRRSELRRLAARFIQTAQWCHEKRPDLQFVAALVNEAGAEFFRQQLESLAVDCPIRVVVGQTHRVMEAADQLLIASGTATLEAALYKRPMVVAYRAAWLTYCVFWPLTRLPWYSLPNILTRSELVPEYIQWGVKPAILGAELLTMLDDTDRKAQMIETFKQLHVDLQRGGSDSAARAIGELLET